MIAICSGLSGQRVPLPCGLFRNHIYILAGPPRDAFGLFCCVNLKNLTLVGRLLFSKIAQALRRVELLEKEVSGATPRHAVCLAESVRIE